MNLRRRLLPLLFVAAAQFAVADEKSYFDVVGKLFGSVESPRVIRDFCATHSPDNALEIARLYDDWRFRNADLLDAVEIQVAHADVRLMHQPPPADAESIDKVRTIMSTKLEEAMQEKSPEWIVQFCSAYPKLIEKKDEEAKTSIRQLLSTAEAAYKELTASQMPAFSEASDAAATLASEPRLKEWMEGEFAAFWKRNLESIVPPCVQAIPESTSVSARLVVDLHSAPAPLRIGDESPTPFSTCVSARMQSLAWPAAPGELRYLPITIDAHAPSLDPKAADDVISNITPSNKSLERTREK